ncbi:LytR C-terminal domain-containing protein [Fusobacterium sp.]|uniref:LytR C-terminal domain-containing protein n=1 Tax=Fusobacterium sp. TaxID=68766 RepID=UPI00263145CE|nr:LytR C-terminal domain-containing protein [Fusobacterium sp.]
MKVGKSKSSNPRMKYVFGGFIVLIILIGTLIYNLISGNKDIKEWDRYMIVGKNNLFVVYEDKLAIKIPFDIQIDKDISFRDLIKVKNYEEILNRVNAILPEKVEKYKVIKYGEVDVNVKNARNIPEVMINDRRHILTSNMESMFDDLLRDKNVKNIANENIIVDILNANGRAGHARRTGERLKNELGVKYNAANYETNGEQSYVIVNDLPKEKVEELIMSVGEKYFKIKEDATIPTLANVVFVLGKEERKIFNVEVVGDSATASLYADTLKKAGYNDVTEKKETVKGTDTLINYNKEDYYIAYKIAKKLGIDKFVEKNDLQNKIIVVVE